MHHHGASDVAELVGVAMQQQEGPIDGRDLLLDTLRGPHQLHAERHPHAAVEVQLIGVIRLHLAGDRGRVRKEVHKSSHFCLFVSIALNIFTDIKTVVV